ncbi:MAG: hypothetical protein H7066_02925 [Cytophagaceae bacterium]|nr:hypothetical protein [Gemmatimonadaceae bacterium]
MAAPSWITSKVAGTIVGIFCAGITVMLIEKAGHALLGTSTPVDPSAITTPMHLSVLVAWVVGVAVGAAVATRWSRATSVVPGMIVGAVLLAGTIANLVAIRHPVWMALAALVLMPVAALLSARALRPAS